MLKTGHVAINLKSARIIEIIGRVTENSQQSLAELHNASSIPRSTIDKILKTHRFHPYKMQIKHELGDGDFDRRIQFC